MIDDGGNMEMHLQKVELLHRQIEEQGERISESFYISVLLNCAPPRYDVQVNILETQVDVTPTIIINRLLEEYRTVLEEKREKPVMAMKGATRNEGKRSGKRFGKFDGKCNHCSK